MQKEDGGACQQGVYVSSPVLLVSSEEVLDEFADAGWEEQTDPLEEGHLVYGHELVLGADVLQGPVA